jgi:phosphohistidine phosphatase
MKIYLVRHGEAEAGADDAKRALTGDGRKAIRRLAEWAAGSKVKPDQIRHSGLVRAEQTAKLLADEIDPPEGLVAVSGLAPDDDVREMTKRLYKETRSVMLVGHNPFMESLAGLLLADDPNRPIVKFSKGQMVCLKRNGDEWELKWSVSPKGLAAL